MDEDELGGLRLSFIAPPPRNIFSDTPFEVKILLQSDFKDKTLTLPLHLRLVDHRGETVQDDSVLTLPGDLSIQNGSQLSVQLKINSAAGLFFRLSVSCPRNHSRPRSISLLSALMQIVQYCLVLQQQPPPFWYKDEGGKDKSILVSAALMDQFGQPVHRKVPVRPVLFYESEDTFENEVKNQSLLKVMPDCDETTHEDGQIEFRLRIEEVSKNHQSQAFVIGFVADVAEGQPADIGAALSTPVTILSKRSKRRKRQEQEEAQKLFPNKVHRSLGPEPASQPTAQARVAAECMQGVATWARSTVQVLKSLEWQHVGFEVTPEGNMNLSALLWRCSSCWAYKDTVRPARHQPDCKLTATLGLFERDADAKVRTLEQILQVRELMSRPDSKVSDLGGPRPVSQPTSQMHPFSAAVPRFDAVSYSNSQASSSSVRHLKLEPNQDEESESESDEEG
jgi:hypothetical protein